MKMTPIFFDPTDMKIRINDPMLFKIYTTKNVM